MNLLCAAGQSPGLVLTPHSDWPQPVSRANPDPLGAVRSFYLHLVADARSDGAWCEWPILSSGTESQQGSCGALGLPCLQERRGHHTQPFWHFTSLGGQLEPESQ